jgi:phospholipid/cholesterol/gamma-HCH transport system substrate-binding protein
VQRVLDPARTVRRLALIVVALIAAVGVAAFASSSSRGAGGPYTVRAIFDDAAFAVPGEDVRIAGATIGSIQSLDVTSNKKAAVTIQISDQRFTPFHENAHCAIRPQSLIGEKYVDCDPGTSSAPELTKITHGPGSGSYYLPVTRTSSPIDTDIVQDISQQPVRESLSIIINEFGTGLASRGSDLNAVIHRANPALGYTDQVFKILARENRTLAQLASDSDAVLTPLARDRQALSGFIVNGNTTSVASASRASAIQQSFQLFPEFLRQLRPLMADLGTLADQGTPLLNSLNQSASALGRQFRNLTPFAAAARSSLINLGNSAAQSQPYLIATIPLAHRLNSLGSAALPSAKSLQQLLTSLDQTGGIEQLMKLLFNGTEAANGFDSVGHYVRDEPQTSDCNNFALSPVPGCSANFNQGSGAADTGSTAIAAKAPAARVAAQAVESAVDKVKTNAPLGGLLDYLIGKRG